MDTLRVSSLHNQALSPLLSWEEGSCPLVPLTLFSGRAPFSLLSFLSFYVICLFLAYGFFKSDRSKDHLDLVVRISFGSWALQSSTLDIIMTDDLLIETLLGYVHDFLPSEYYLCYFYVLKDTLSCVLTPGDNYRWNS
jgi:hypothetical protein